MFKVYKKDGTNTRAKVVYATRLDDKLGTMFLFYYFEGWCWEIASDYVPINE